MRRALLVLGFAAALSWTAFAQDNPPQPQPQPQPAMSEPELRPGAVEQEKPYLPQKDTYRLFVLGDSLAAGLGLGMARVAQGDQRLIVDGRYKEDSGLARPEFYDWNEAVPKILESNEMDIAVIMIGANDSRDIRHGDLRYVFGTQEWTNAYVAQIDRLIDGLKQAGSAVYWVELPPMQAEKYDAAMKAITIVQRERAKAKGVRFIDDYKAFLGPNGAYTAAGFDSAGELHRMRDPDGVHLQEAGNDKLARLVLAAIGEDIKAAAAAPKQEPAQPDGSDMTVFRRGPAGGPDTIYAAPISDLVTGPPAPLTHDQVVSQTIPGSSAERLLKLGESQTPPPGRFDDFSMPEGSAR